MARRATTRRTRTSYEARTIRSRFSNRCYACNGAIQVGDLIIWSPNRRGEARHANCHSITPMESATTLVDRQQSGFVVREIKSASVALAKLNLRCPYCRDFFDSISDLVQCQGCSTHFHADCFHQNKKCTVIGCVSTITVTLGASNYRPNEVIIENTRGSTTLFQNAPNESVFSSFVSENEVFVPVFKMVLAIAVCVVIIWLLSLL